MKKLFVLFIAVVVVSLVSTSAFAGGHDRGSVRISNDHGSYSRTWDNRDYGHGGNHGNGGMPSWKDYGKSMIMYGAPPAMYGGGCEYGYGYGGYGYSRPVYGPPPVVYTQPVIYTRPVVYSQPEVVYSQPAQSVPVVVNNTTVVNNYQQPVSVPATSTGNFYNGSNSAWKPIYSGN